MLGGLRDLQERRFIVSREAMESLRAEADRKGLVHGKKVASGGLMVVSGSRRCPGIRFEGDKNCDSTEAEAL